MYESFYGLKEKPFSMLPDPGFLYLSKKHQKALTLFEYGLMNHAGFCVISGEIGSGKTTILRKLLENMSRKIAVGMITNTHKGFGDLLDWVLSAFGIHEKGLTEVEKHQRFVDFLIEQYAAKKTTLLIVDEAQNMAADKLEELRMLSNINADKDQILQIILAGQPELKETLALPELKQFVQRIAVDYHLGSLDLEDTRGYIAHRLSVAGAKEPIFTEAACDMIFKYSGGTPRLINLLCDTAMVYGFADQQILIDEDLVAEMIEERMHNSLVPLACTELPKKKLRESVTGRRLTDQVSAIGKKNSAAAVSGSADTDAAEHDFGEKILRAAAPQHQAKADAEKAVEPEIKIEAVPDSHVAVPAQHPVAHEPEAAVQASSEASFPPGQAKQSRLLKPMLAVLATLVIATLLFALSLDDERTDSATAVVEVSKYKSEPEVIQREADAAREVVQTIPDAIKKQLDEAQKIQQEMVQRQQEDRLRMQALEEQTAALQAERDNAIASALAEKEKRAAEARAARLAAEREQEAQRVAQRAISEAMAAENKAKLLEELRLREQQLREAQARENALAQQASQAAALEAEKLEAAAKIEADKKNSLPPSDARCEGVTARFLSICR